MADDLCIDAAEIDSIVSGTHRQQTAGHDLPGVNAPLLAPIPIGDLGPGVPHDYLWHPYLAGGCVTLLAASPKAGKTTLLSHLIRDMEQGDGLVTEPIEGPVLLLTEEPESIWRARRDLLGIGGDFVHLQRPTTLGHLDHDRWSRLADEIVERVRDEPGYRLVVVDTLGAWWSCNDENSATDANVAMIPLRRIANAGAAVLIAHHTRKSGGEGGTGTRGSGAIVAAVDVLIELDRFDKSNSTDTRRVLKSLSRLDQTPDEVVVELGPDGYRVQGPRSKVTAIDRTRTAVSLLPNPSGKGLSIDEVREAWPDDSVPGTRRLRDLLMGAVESGMAIRHGDGKAGSPYRWTRGTANVMSGGPAPLGAGPDSTEGDSQRLPDYDRPQAPEGWPELPS